MADLVDRRYLSRYSQPTFALRVYKAGVLADADALPMVSFTPEGGAVEWTQEAVRVSTGLYEISLSSIQTSSPVLGNLMWSYAIDGQAQVYGVDLEVGPSAPAYDALPQDWQGIIEGVWVKFADLFDSPYGGPNLQVYVQTHFGRNRLAQLMSGSLQALNTASSPHAHYEMGASNFPFREWGGLMEDALYIEVLKHLVRSYVEQPEAILGTAVSRLDRRDYMNRWREVLDMETRGFEANLKKYRAAHLGLGNFSVLVAGGAYGNYGPAEPPGGAGAAASRGYHMFSRWH